MNQIHDQRFYITIEQDRLQTIPENYEIIEGLPIVSAGKSDTDSTGEDGGPAPGQFERLSKELTTSPRFAAKSL